jgi:hypothetical protein
MQHPVVAMQADLLAQVLDWTAGGMMSADERMNWSIYGDNATASGDTTGSVGHQGWPDPLAYPSQVIVKATAPDAFQRETDILEGRYPAPPEFAPLYAVLSAIAMQHTAAQGLRSGTTASSLEYRFCCMRLYPARAATSRHLQGFCRTSVMFHCC